MKQTKTCFQQGRWLTVLAGLTAVAGLWISLHLRSRIAQSEAASARLSAETLRLNTEQELALFVDVLESVRALHALSDEVSTAAMNEFVEKGMVYQRAVLGEFGLAQRIGPGLRTALEEAARIGTGGGYSVVQKGPEGTWIPSDPRSVYYPLTWQSRSDALGVPVGFDFSSQPCARQAIKRMERTGRAVLSDCPPDLTKSGSSAHWVFAPVTQHRSESAILHSADPVIGFSVALLNPDTVLRRVVSFSASAAGIRLNLLPGSPGVDAGAPVIRINGTWLYRHPIRVADQIWLFECRMPLAAAGRGSAAALAIGLIITVLMTSQLLIIAGRTRKIEAEVRARTDELRIANIRLEENLHERVRLEEEMNELAARERRQLGRDLHDSLGQKLAGAVFLSRSLLDGLAGTEAESEKKAHARTLNETLKTAVGQVRDMARGLASVSLNDESLGEALEQLAEEMTGVYGVSCEVTGCSEIPGLDRKTKEQLYLIAREAVNNAARHAGARHVKISLTGSETAWKLSVEDDGKGMPPEQPDGEGMGIRIMRHRARLIGACFSLTSVPNQGTDVLAEKKNVSL